MRDDVHGIEAVAAFERQRHLARGRALGVEQDRLDLGPQIGEDRAEIGYRGVDEKDFGSAGQGRIGPRIRATSCCGRQRMNLAPIEPGHNALGRTRQRLIHSTHSHHPCRRRLDGKLASELRNGDVCLPPRTDIDAASHGAPDGRTFVIR
ncbi:hypothetical protein [Mesorhizobium japonicum]|uniref:hypothetical protein n=1 Tax=Mesorhizobium japonicum TaxID=2066070 RepID=UPI0005C9F5B2|nr:hypothetical protein [Mesorhizobium japonicum]